MLWKVLIVSLFVQGQGERQGPIHGETHLLLNSVSNLPSPLTS